MSMGMLMAEGQALIGEVLWLWKQLIFKGYLWKSGSIIYWLCPPGTGDVDLTLAQSVMLSAE